MAAKISVCASGSLVWHRSLTDGSVAKADRGIWHIDRIKVMRPDNIQRGMGHFLAKAMDA